MTLSGALPNYNVYRCLCGRYVMLGALEERFFRSFLRQVGQEGLLDGVALTPEGLKALRPKLEEIFASRTREEWQALFMNNDVCLAPVNSMSEAFSDPQLNARGMVQKMSHPDFGEFLMIGSPFHFSGSPVSYRLPPPRHGQHTEEVLMGLGYDSEQIGVLRGRRAI